MPAPNDRRRHIPGLLFARPISRAPWPLHFRSRNVRSSPGRVCRCVPTGAPGTSRRKVLAAATERSNAPCSGSDQFCVDIGELERRACCGLSAQPIKASNACFESIARDRFMRLMGKAFWRKSSITKVRRFANDGPFECCLSAVLVTGPLSDNHPLMVNCTLMPSTVEPLPTRPRSVSPGHLSRSRTDLMKEVVSDGFGFVSKAVWLSVSVQPFRCRRAKGFR